MSDRGLRRLLRCSCSCQGQFRRDLIGHLRGAGFIASGPRSPTPGAPYTYVTTKEFLLEFGFDTLRDLPDFEALEDAGLLHRPNLAKADLRDHPVEPGACDRWRQSGRDRRRSCRCETSQAPSDGRAWHIKSAALAVQDLIGGQLAHNRIAFRSR
ncbi:putative transcriptional regulator [Mesorhizobium alhagi CCNWXJ12-2]|uniref:Putative transcriptional regulator n=1 Tax=Mesorhizobium alhagi CCNWXJ12-2 TaxID=1107882 RepID=H0HWV8_9HYPH|nr:putative transcriptional regulator [Mesorhizobium alhagi CCNWXJ12-2]